MARMNHCSESFAVFGRLTVALVLGVVIGRSAPIDAQAYEAALPAATPLWQQIRMDTLTVIGTARAAVLRQVATGIAAFQSALMTYIPDARVSGPDPTFVVVLEDFAAYKRYQPRDGRGRRIDSIAGYLNVAADGNFLVFPYVRGEVGSSLIFHEYTHYVLRQNTELFVPLWLEEGLAEFYSTFQPNVKDGSVLGTAPPDRLRTLRQEPYVSLRALVSPSHIGQIVRSARSGVFYAEAWALVHYISLERKNPVPNPFKVYLTTLAETDSQDEAFKAAFGVDVDGMDRELQEYVRFYSYRTLFVPRAEPLRVEDVEVVPEEDVRQLESALIDGRDAPEEPEDLRPF